MTNMIPSTPRNISRKKDQSDILLTWPPADDPDGMIREYVVYKKTGSGIFRKPGVSKEPSFRIVSRDMDDDNTVKIVAIDDVGAASEPVIVSFSKDKIIEVVEQNADSAKALREKNSSGSNRSFFIELRPVFVYPFARFGELNKYGYGGLITCYRQNVVFTGAQLGIDTGIIQWENKADGLGKMITVPATARIGYRLKLTDSFSVNPSLSMGGLFLTSEYKNGSNRSVRKNDFEPAATASLALMYAFENSYLVCGASFNMIYEKSGVQKFAGVSIGLGSGVF